MAPDRKNIRSAKYQRACKPGSVHRTPFPCGQASGWATIPLGPGSLPASSDQPGRSGQNMPATLARGAPPLFGLAPGGVFRATTRCRGRGRLLPYPFTFHAAEAQGPKA
jgi:hypothetical protein